jgi:hypothetical protein
MKILKSIIVIWMAILVNSEIYGQDIFSNKIREKLEDQISRFDSCMAFGLSYPTAVRDSLDRIIGFKELAVFENDSLKQIILKNRTTINQTLYEMLNSENISYSWSANLMLFYYNAVDATNLEDFIPNNCAQWYLNGRDTDILYWKGKLFIE